MANEQSFESLKDEILNSNDLTSNRKRKGKSVKGNCKTRKSEKLVRRGGRIGLAPFFGQTNMARVCFIRFLGRLFSQTIESKRNMLHSFGQHCLTSTNNLGFKNVVCGC